MHRIKPIETNLPYPLYRYLLLIAIVVYPSFLILDWIVYPAQFSSSLVIRGSVAAYLALSYFLINRTQGSLHGGIILSCLYVAASGITLMCRLSGEGFDSPYYAGVLQIVVCAAMLTNISPKQYAFLVAAVLVQHFLSLWTGPMSYRGLAINVFGLGIFSILCLFIHHHVCRLDRENRTLRGILPICAKCKKIRNDEGYWQDVALYISIHTDAEFSHGMCPDCVKELFIELNARKQLGDRMI